ncbi:hypothetical protein C8J56DRAFT_879923 [Mycena floridula]|nr:hypothetical protein C8J56DRAFT_879923 [Mycena floridula]
MASNEAATEAFEWRHLLQGSGLEDDQCYSAVSVDIGHNCLGQQRPGDSRAFACTLIIVFLLLKRASTVKQDGRSLGKTKSSEHLMNQNIVERAGELDVKEFITPVKDLTEPGTRLEDQKGRLNLRLMISITKSIEAAAKADEERPNGMKEETKSRERERRHGNGPNKADGSP